jgi:hypothetical protein
MAKHPRIIANDRSFLKVWPLLFWGLAVLVPYFWFDWSTSPVGPLSVVVIYSGLIILLCVQATRWKRMHKMRQQAASEGIYAGIPLASPQPVPNREVLPLPCQLTLQPRWFRLLVCTLLVGGVAFVVWGLVVEETLDLLKNWPFQLILPFIWSAQFFWRPSLSQRIMISADELLVRDPLYDWLGNGWQTGEHRITWEEARLFAIRGGTPGMPATRYELSGPTTAVTFGRARPRRWWGLYRPVLTWENYDFQMDALLDLISAKTGLPLYDIRTGPAPGSLQGRWLLRRGASQ